MILGLYRLATDMGAPVIAAYLNRRMARGKEDRTRFAERLGNAGLPRPDGKVIWMHGASVGESLSMLPVISAFSERPDAPTILVTTGTVTSARLMRERLPDNALHQFIPVDRLAYVEKFLNHWRPDIVLWWESELWPNLVTETHARGIPLLLVNARMSPKSFEKWRHWRGFARTLLRNFDVVLAQTDADAARYEALGAQNVERLGNLKFAVPPLPCDEGTLAEIRTRTGLRPIWLAASTHAGEEDIAWNVHQRLRALHPDLLTIIVPRHPERGPDIAAALRDSGAIVAIRSNSEPVTPECDVYLADTMGELGLFFRLAPIVFMGKSLVPEGGQNPIEPARLGAAVITGPHFWNFDEVMKSMARDGGLEIVADADALFDAVAADLSDPTRAQTRAQAALAYAESESRVLDNFLDRLEPMIKATDHAPA